MSNAQQIIDEAATLSAEDRVVVVDFLLKTLTPPDPDIDRLWANEATRRLDELRSGKVTAIPAEDVLEKARKRLEQ
ncbi:MAG TPA: addiction module protein [Planctomycetaceae bacterium]|nr:addiction module protein [Planctomycetaceae bacterium]